MGLASGKRSLIPRRRNYLRSTGCWPAGSNLKSLKQIGHRRVGTPCDDLQRDNSRLALATFNVRQVSPVHVEMDGEAGDDLWRTAMSCEKYREALIDAAAAGEQVKADLPNTSRNAHSVALHCNASKCCLRRSTTLWAGE